MAYDLIRIFKKLELIPSNVILVGAWEGGEVRVFLEAGVQRAYLFEAEPTALRKLEEIYGNESRVKIIQGAVSSEAGNLQKFYVLNHGSSSLFAPNLVHLKKIISDFFVEREILVRTITLDSSLRNCWEIWNSNGLDTLLILDIQGGELEALRGAPGLLEKVGWILAEVSTSELYKNQNTLKQLDQYLNGKGFHRLSIRLYPKRNHGDALYFRSNLVTKAFVRTMKMEDIHWNLARMRPAWIPSLSQTKLGRLILKLVWK